MDLEVIYKAYPRHRDKICAIRAISKALQRIQSGETGKKMSAENSADYLLERTAKFARSLAGNRGTYTAYPATWFSRGGYLDDDHEWDLMNTEEYEDAMRTKDANVGVWRPS